MRLWAYFLWSFSVWTVFGMIWTVCASNRTVFHSIRTVFIANSTVFEKYGIKHRTKTGLDENPVRFAFNRFYSSSKT